MRIFPPVILNGYDAEVIETIFQKTLGYTPKQPLHEVTGKSTVLAFGGCCGVHYKQAVLVNPNVKWAVVESPLMVRRASELSTDRLRFFSSIEEAKDWLGPIDMMHSCGALQYCASPVDALRGLCSVGAGEMVWTRLLLSKTDHIEHDEQFIGLSHNGPGISLSRKVVRNMRAIFPERDFISEHAAYVLRKRTEDSFHFVKSRAEFC